MRTSLKQRTTLSTRRAGGARPGGSAEILAAAFLWGTAGPVSTLAPGGASTVGVSSVRMVVGGLLLFSLAALTSRGRGLRAMLARDGRTRAMLAVGAVCAALYQTAYYAALARTGVAVATVVALGCAPAFTGLIARTGLSRRWLASTVGAVAGCALLVGGGGGSGADPVGVLLALLCGLVYAVYTTITSRLIAGGEEPRAVTGALFGGAALLLAPALFVLAPGWILAGTGLLITCYLGVLTIALAYTLFARGLRTTPAATATTLTLAEPAVAALIGLTLLGEDLGGLAAGGLALLAASLVVLVV
ncbi:MULTISPECIES: DMT family transporter [Thermomonosporaceae]|uniref:DMT family transporter n=1 Tax=Thermomonosporaceae TaxID=2012 RepID=UPI00255B0451|nr:MULTISPECIES: EamA family transporter [Thermomonosporaceae]MDL4771158.1 EamA family transporter [Actinomadura xylanilytica]